MMKNLKVVMLGPSLAEKGGMGSVSQLIIQSSPSSVQIEHLSTWNGAAIQLGQEKRLWVFLRVVIIFFWKLLKGEVDLVHIHLAERGSVLRKSILTLIASAFRKPIIMHCHGCEFQVFYLQLPTVLKQLVTWVLKKCTYVIVLSESWKDFYVNHCNLAENKVIVLHNPVLLPEQIPERKNVETLKFVFLGKINQRKGVYDLVQALAKLSIDEQKKIQLILAGTGEEDQVREYADKLGITQNLVFPGWINSEQRDQLLTEADVFVLPSYQEGLPMALLEAMSWQLPCITTPVGGIPEVITDGETGLLVEPGNIEQLTTAIRSLILDQSLRLKLGQAAREQVKPFNIHNYSQSLLKWYYAAIQRYPKPYIKSDIVTVLSIIRNICRSLLKIT